MSLVSLDRTANKAVLCPALISWALWALVRTEAYAAHTEVKDKNFHTRKKDHYELSDFVNREKLGRGDSHDLEDENHES